jgi:superfamily II DNA or RNA helicase
MVKHPYLNKVKKLRLFKNVESFDQIEEQIRNHSLLAKDQGDAFEVFAEAFLKLGLNAPYKEVYPENEILIEHFKRLKIKPTSKNVRGIDGVLITPSEDLHTYQVKFRSSKEKLSWNECTGSDAASRYADGMLVFTNLPQIDGDISQRDYVYSIKKDFLLTLNREDFSRIEKLLYSKGDSPSNRITLEPYQRDAVSSVLNDLKTKSRTQLIMPCGSGKTIVGQRVVEGMKDVNLALVLVPTLQLLEDIFNDYYRNTSWENFPYLCIGSKVIESQSYDQIQMLPEDLPFISNTDVTSVRKFLNLKFEKRIIFSTYHSLPVLAEALGRKKIDIAIFDEAHNTASRKGNHWSFGLEDKNIKIRKRVFLTATPRKFRLRSKSEENMRKVFSMDDAKVYGHASYKLTFRQAAHELGVICKYKIIISIISSDYICRNDLKHSKVLVDKLEVNADWVAKQIALADAVRKNDIKKIISFHPRISNAAEFVGNSESSIQHRLKGFKLFTVSSKQSAEERRLNMKSFRHANNALISNAQCLNEGVDVPAVDMVAFMHPKRNTVSIVQATGRAIRKPRGSKKELGYLFVPIFLEKKAGETDIEAAQRSNFRDLYEVINALREHDEVLDDIIKKLRIQKGHSRNLDDILIDDYIQFTGIDISLPELRSFITSEIVDKTSDNWFFRYGELKAFYEKNGHSRVPPKSKKYRQLGTWLDHQRLLATNQKLSSEKLNLLDQVEFVIDPYEKDWDDNFEILKAYFLENGHCNLKPRENMAVSRWLKKVRSYIKQGGYREDRIERLKSINFDFSPDDTIWEKQFDELAEFKEQNGHCRVPQSYKKNISLGVWVSTQRGKLSKGNLPKNKKEKLDSLGFSWNPREEIWEDFFKKMKVFKKENGHCRVPKGCSKDPKLSMWVQEQRTLFAGNKLRKERENLLLEIGFSFNPDEDLWNNQFEKLKNYKTEHGDTNVTQSYTKDSALGSWVNTQRVYFRKGKLDNDKIKALNEVGFVWELGDKIWEENIQALKNYKKENGHCNVPRTKGDRLTLWLNRQRDNYRKQKISKERITELEEIGIDWNPLETQWNQKFSELEIFHKKFSHSEVLRSQDVKLSSWCTKQRNAFKNKRLPEDKITKLSKLGFRWTTQTNTK